MRSALTVILLCVLLGPARAGDDPFSRFLVGARSAEADRRREAFESILAAPGMVPDDRRERAVRVLLDAVDGDREPALRGLAARCLAPFRSTETDLAIVQRLSEESDHLAQLPMLDALEGVADETVIAFLVKRIWRDPRPDVRSLYVLALGRSPTDAAREELVRLAGLPLPWPVLTATALALCRYPEKEVVDRLVDLLWAEPPGVASAAYESLVRLTGKRDLAEDAAAWVAWWADAREEFRFPGAARPEGAEVKSVVADPVTLPTYYDIPIRGRKVVFCLDISASMWGPKIEAAKAELARAIRCLRSDYEFDVIFFNERPSLWRPGLRPAYPFQKLACVTEFDALTTKMYTNLFDSLELALGFAGLGRYAREDAPGVDDVFLVTDGEPNRGRRRDVKGILAGLAEIDPAHRVRIHTISIGEDPKELLTAIATARGGTHVHIPAEK